MAGSLKAADDHWDCFLSPTALEGAPSVPTADVAARMAIFRVVDANSNGQLCPTASPCDCAGLCPKGGSSGYAPFCIINIDGLHIHAR